MIEHDVDGNEVVPNMWEKLEDPGDGWTLEPYPPAEVLIAITVPEGVSIKVTINGKAP